MISLVHGPDDLDADRRALALHDPAAGVVAVTCPVVADGITRLAGDILAALGKDREAAPEQATGTEESRLAVCWLRAWEIEHLIIDQAQWLTDGAVPYLAALAAAADVDLWLLSHPGLRRAAEAALRNAGTARVEPAAFWAAAAAFRRPIQLEPSLAPTRSGPSVAELLDRPSRAGMLASEAATSWALTHHPLDPTTVARFIEVALAACRSEPEAADTLHGLAAGLRARGLELAALRGRVAGRGDGSLWHGLNRFRDPMLAAASTLAKLRVGINEMLELRLHDIAGGAIELDDETVFVPRSARPLIAAQRWARESDGALPDSFFLRDRAGRPSPLRLRKSVLAVLETVDPDTRIDDVMAGGSRSLRWLAGEGVELRRTRERIAPPRIGAAVDDYARLIALHLSGSAIDPGDEILAVPGQPRRARPAADHPFKRSYDRPRREAR